MMLYQLLKILKINYVVIMDSLSQRNLMQRGTVISKTFSPIFYLIIRKLRMI